MMRIPAPKYDRPLSEPFDITYFQAEFDTCCICVPAKTVNVFRKALGTLLMDYPGIASVRTSPADHPTYRRILLKSDQSLSDIQDELSDEVKTLIDAHNCSISEFSVDVGYRYWTAEEILRATLPESVEIAHSFETVGHIAHLNLREEHWEYRHIIGQVIYELNANIKTVVTKTGNIESQFRTFPMEVLAGEDRLETLQSENGCRFKFDFSKVYWNSRLSTEHTRLIDKFVKTDWVLDVCAGVGPFALPAAKKGCHVLANDLNPDSFASMNSNICINKLSDASIETFNEDGCVFIERTMALLSDSDAFTTRAHFVLNLPAAAITFLGSFNSADYDVRLKGMEVWIHCYCFKRVDVTEREHLEYVEENLGEKLSSYEMHFVRKVAPNKDMFCLSFLLPCKRQAITADGEHREKKLRIDSSGLC